MTGLTADQLDGIACVFCIEVADPGVPVGLVDGGQVFACTRCTNRHKVTHLQIVDNPGRVQVVLHRLADVFTSLRTTEPQPVHGQAGTVRVHVFAEL